MKHHTPPVLDFQNVFHSLDTAYIIFAADDPAFTIIGENQAHADMAMVRREDVLGKPVLEAFPDTSESYRQSGKSELLESLRKVIATGKSDTMPHLSYDLKNQEGVLTQKFWEVIHQPVFENGKVVAVCQQTLDITDKVLTERELSDAQLKLDQALEYSAVGTWQWDLVNNVTIADRNFAHLFSVECPDKTVTIAPEEIMERIHPEDRKRLTKLMDAAIKDRSTYEGEFRVLRPGGGVKWLLGRGKAEYNEDGKPIRFPGAVVEITELKVTERKLQLISKASEQFSASLDYRKTLDSIAKIVVPGIADWCSIDMLEDGKIELVSLAHVDPQKVEWARQLRANQGPIPLDAPSGSAWVIRTGKTELTPVITDEMLVAAAKNKKELKLLRDLQLRSAITVPMKIDGKLIGAMTLISTEAERYYDEDDVDVAQALANRAALAVYNANLFQNAKTEIAERKKLQDELEALNQDLEQRVEERTLQLKEYSAHLSRSNQELQDFAYVASHDLQEPLRKIRAFGDILMAEYKTGLGDGAEYLERMQNAAARMSILIEDLLAFSRVTTRPPVHAMVDLRKIAEEVTGDLEYQIERTKGAVDIGDLPSIEADPTHMRQLFQNLIGNALKFSRPGVPPVVKVWSETSKRPKAQYSIYVQDNGIGFDEKYLDRIFSVFQRLHGKDSYEGTGIGLAVVRKIAERYGGSITATSKKNVGSTFTVTFPAHKKKEK